MDETIMHLTCVAGARPNFMKVAPILSAAHGVPGLTTSLVHTGQHYDARMSDQLFVDLGLPTPDVYLGVGSASHAAQTARVMLAFDEVLDSRPTNAVIVVGDVNSTLACALVAAKRGVPVAHVEAGLRSGDRSMPEEVNRVLTDQLATFLFTTEREAGDNLAREGVDPRRIHFVGNVMIDTLLQHRDRARATGAVRALGLEPGAYAVGTFHRPANVDTPDAAVRTIQALALVSLRLPVVLPLHPRTRARWQAFGLLGTLADMNVRLLEPLGYLEFLAVMADAALVLTDSGGIQEETTVLGVPCLTYRDNTERPITITQGTNRLVGRRPDAVAAATDEILEGRWPAARVPELWDGHAAERIVGILAHELTRPGGVVALAG